MLSIADADEVREGDSDEYGESEHVKAERLAPHLRSARHVTLPIGFFRGA